MSFIDHPRWGFVWSAITATLACVGVCLGAYANGYPGLGLAMLSLAIGFGFLGLVVATSLVRATWKNSGRQWRLTWPVTREPRADGQRRRGSVEFAFSGTRLHWDVVDLNIAGLEHHSEWVEVTFNVENHTGTTVIITALGGECRSGAEIYSREPKLLDGPVVVRDGGIAPCRIRQHVEGVGESMAIKGMGSTAPLWTVEFTYMTCTGEYKASDDTSVEFTAPITAQSIDILGPIDRYLEDGGATVRIRTRPQFGSATYYTAEGLKGR